MALLLSYLSYCRFYPSIFALSSQIHSALTRMSIALKNSLKFFFPNNTDGVGLRFCQRLFRLHWLQWWVERGASKRMAWQWGSLGGYLWRGQNLSGLHIRRIIWRWGVQHEHFTCAERNRYEHMSEGLNILWLPSKGVVGKVISGFRGHILLSQDRNVQ